MLSGLSLSPVNVAANVSSDPEQAVYSPPVATQRDLRHSIHPTQFDSRFLEDLTDTYLMMHMLPNLPSCITHDFAKLLMIQE